MSYTKTNWAENTPITAALLNKIENGIEAAIKEAETAIKEAETAIKDAETALKEAKAAMKEAETLPTPLEIGARPDTKPEWGAWFQGTPEIRSDGVMEVGRYIDFHFNSEHDGDYNTRLEGTEDGRLLISGRHAAMFEASSPKHHLIRYGKGLPGLDGFITFSL